MGEATALIAKADPQTGFVAVEMHSPGLAALLILINQHELKNLRLIREDATYLLANFIADSTLDGVHLLFPDPWRLFATTHHSMNPEVRVKYITTCLCAHQLESQSW